MKRKSVIALTLSAVLSLGVSGAAAVAETDKAAPTAKADETAKVYLVPGAWYDGATKAHVPNSVDGATALSETEKTALHLENNVYLAGEIGSALPTAQTTREGYTFNGWWTIENATVTYVETVPQTKEPLYLYADFRAALSQPQAPVNPPEDAEEEIAHYMRVEHQDTGEVEIIPLFVSGTDVSSACTAGYSGPVQFYNEWFELRANDLIQVYVSNIYGDKPEIAPKLRGNPEPKCGVTLERSGSNNTAEYIARYNADKYGTFVGVDDPTLKYTSDESHHFRIYIKFYDDGGYMTIYMERKD